MLKYFMYKPIPYDVNQMSRNGHKIEYIVIHDTANPGYNADALRHQKFFSKKRGASAHYFVDSERIVQIVGDSRASYAVGDNQGWGRFLNGCNNRNSLSIELCINSNGNYNEAYYNLVELVKNLMARYNIPASKVCRHYDVSHKLCPGTFTKNNWQKWWRFKEEIKAPINIYIDTSKNYSIPQPVNKKTEPKKKPNIPASWAKKGWEYCKKEKILDGNRPLDSITREELAVIIYRLYGNNETASRYLRTDKPSPWAITAWYYCTDKELVDGTRPKDNLTREELSLIIYRTHKLLNKEPIKTTKTQYIPGNKPSTWAKDSWEYCTAQGILDGRRPHDKVTRQEIATIIYRITGGNSND